MFADIINYQIDVDFAQKFAPEITKLLADADRDVVRNAAELSHDLSKSEAAWDSIQLNFNRMFNRVLNRVHYTLCMAKCSVENPVEHCFEIQLN